MAATALTYRYPFASQLTAQPAAGGDWGLDLATFNPRDDAPSFFFEGRLAEPDRVAKELLLLSGIVRTRFYQPLTVEMLDPVVTANDGALRFEGFSGCCGVYARVDLGEEAVQATIHRRGTTNVDFNQPMRNALNKVRARDDVALAVGADQVRLTTAAGATVERKVKLPDRWVRGFTEVAAYQPRLHPVHDVSGAEARRFLRSLPRSGGNKRPIYVVGAGRGLRASSRESVDSVRVLGTDRIRVLDPIAGDAQRLVVHSDDIGSSAWVLETPTTRFTLLVSPEIYRGFSGEGQVLEDLATGAWEEALPRVRAALRWQSRLDDAALAEATGFEVDAIRGALAVLGSRGLVGFDATEGSYFHRELPFDLSGVEKAHPRLRGAQRLIEENGVRMLSQGEVTEARVRGTDTEHHVRVTPSGASCTCTWWAKHHGERGPCKHVLAVRMVAE